MQKRMIYVADDEEKIRELVKSFLTKDGFDVRLFADGAQLLEAFNELQPDMIIVDITMPKMDGFSVCSIVRNKSNVPIVIISARDTEPDRIAGLTLGSDDYITKPFSPMELVARVKSIFRRIDFERKEPLKTDVLQFGDVVIFHEAKKAECNGVDIGLTVMEFSFLAYLTNSKNRAVSREELLNRVWGFDSQVETRATDDMVKRIRKKLSICNSSLNIETVWGFGFKISD